MTDLVDRLNGPTSELRRLRETVAILSSQHLECHNGTKDSECSECKEWRREVNSNLAKLKYLSENKPYSDDEAASVIATVAEYYLGDGDDYINLEIRDSSDEILTKIPLHTKILLRVLDQHVKPLFLSSPHPSLNLSTGRALPRPAGGSNAVQDHFEDQAWKSHHGIDGILSWCIQHASSDSYEAIWHLLIPPVMTFIDDYQMPCKLKGIQLASQLVQHAPKNLLLRTGVGQLIITSLFTALAFLQDDLTPQLIRTAVPVLLQSIDLTTDPGSEERFDKQCHLLGECIIGGVWIYASNDVRIIQASFDVLPAIMAHLGIGTVRYLKALIPQCTHILTMDPALHPDLTGIFVSALTALEAVIKHCQPRIHRWKGTIIEGVAKSWVLSTDSHGGIDQKQIESHYRDVFTELANACPSVLEDEFVKLHSLDSAFCNILPPQNQK